MPVGTGTITGHNGDCHSSVAQSVRGMGWWWRPRQWVPNVNSGLGARKYHAPPDVRSVLYTGKTNRFIHAVRFIHRSTVRFIPENGSFYTGKRFVLYRENGSLYTGKRFVLYRKTVRFIHRENEPLLFHFYSASNKSMQKHALSML